jgi:hypothetical protein
MPPWLAQTEAGRMPAEASTTGVEAMFIKWKHQSRTYCYRRYTEGRRKAAAVVRSVRTPAGPRHEYICHLGSVVEDRTGYLWGREWFWIIALWKLDRAGITGADRERIEAALEKTIPRPEPD